MLHTHSYNLDTSLLFPFPAHLPISLPSNPLDTLAIAKCGGIRLALRDVVGDSSIYTQISRWSGPLKSWKGPLGFEIPASKRLEAPCVVIEILERYSASAQVPDPDRPCIGSHV